MKEPEQLQPHPESLQDYRSEAECAEFQASMAYRIGAGEDLRLNPHMLTCERCRAFFSDLEAIVDALIVAFPVEVDPPDEVWNRLQSQIALEDPPVDESHAVKEDIAPLTGEIALEGGVA